MQASILIHLRPAARESEQKLMVSFTCVTRILDRDIETHSLNSS